MTDRPPVGGPGRLANVIGGLVALAAGVFFLSLFQCPAEPPPARPADQADQVERLLLDLAEPCTSRAYFTKLLGTWYATLGEAHLDVGRAFPEHRGRIIREIEAVGAGDDVPVAGLLEAIGECP